jgi:hypothetical protein
MNTHTLYRKHTDFAVNALCEALIESVSQTENAEQAVADCRRCIQYLSALTALIVPRVSHALRQRISAKSNDSVLYRSSASLPVFMQQPPAQLLSATTQSSSSADMATLDAILRPFSFLLPSSDMSGGKDATRDGAAALQAGAAPAVFQSPSFVGHDLFRRRRVRRRRPAPNRACFHTATAHAHCCRRDGAESIPAAHAGANAAAENLFALPAQFATAGQNGSHAAAAVAPAPRVSTQAPPVVCVESSSLAAAGTAGTHCRRPHRGRARRRPGAHLVSRLGRRCVVLGIIRICIVIVIRIIRIRIVIVIVIVIDLDLAVWRGRVRVASLRHSGRQCGRARARNALLLAACTLSTTGASDATAKRSRKSNADSTSLSAFASSTSSSSSSSSLSSSSASSSSSSSSSSSLSSAAPVALSLHQLALVDALTTTAVICSRLHTVTTGLKKV